MNNVKKGLLITSFILANPAYAEKPYEPHSYFGFGYTFVDMEDLGYSASNGLLGAIFGYRFHKNIAIDFRGYANVSDDELYGVSIEVERSFSALAKGILPVNDYVYLYGMFGVATSKITARYNSNSASATDEDLQYGLGMSINKSNGEPLETQVEWLKLYDEDGFDATGINLNIVYNF